MSADGKGERGSPLVFWKLLECEGNEGNANTVPVSRYYTVFKVDQTNHKRLDEIVRPKRRSSPRLSGPRLCSKAIRTSIRAVPWRRT